MCIYIYIGWWYTNHPENEMNLSDWIIIPTIGENKHVPNNIYIYINKNITILPKP